MRTLRLLLITLLMAPGAYATDKKAGTAGAQFLKIGAGARSTAMGDAFVGVADDANAAYFNPAGLSNIERPELTGMHTQWIQDLNYDFAAFVYPTDRGAFAVSAATLKVPDIPKRSSDESLLGSFDQLDASYGLSYARNLSPLFSMGVTARYISQEIDSVSASGWSGDLGLFKRFESSPVRLGLAVRHLGPAIEFREESDPLPLTIDAGASSTFWREKLLLAADVKKARDNETQFGVGAEYRPTFGRDFHANFRGGYNTAATEADDATGVSFGAGFGYRRFDFDFAWVPFGALGNTFRYAATLKF